MRSEFQYTVSAPDSEYAEFDTCERCGSIAPLQMFKCRNYRLSPSIEEDQSLCEICAETVLGNILNSPHLYLGGSPTLVQGIVQALNLILDKTTGRRPLSPRTEVVTP